MKIKIVVIFTILLMIFCSAQAEGKKETKTKFKIKKNISIGKVTPPQKDSRIYTSKEIKKHKDSNAGSPTAGVTIDF